MLVSKKLLFWIKFAPQQPGLNLLADHAISLFISGHNRSSLSYQFNVSFHSFGCDTGAAGPEVWSALEQSKYHPNPSRQVVEKYPWFSFGVLALFRPRLKLVAPKRLVGPFNFFTFKMFSSVEKYILFYFFGNTKTFAERLWQMLY